MSWTFTNAPNTSTLDQVRLLIGDTNEDDQLLTDEVINFALGSFDSTRAAAIKCCEFIIAQLSRDVDHKIGPEQVSASQRVSNYNSLLRTLRKQQELAQAVPTADVSTNRLFDIGMFDCKTQY